MGKERSLGRLSCRERRSCRGRSAMSEKLYPVPAAWKKRAYLNDADYKKMYGASIKDPDKFWAKVAKRIHWMKPFKKVKNTTFGPGTVSIKWFEDGKTNSA